MVYPVGETAPAGSYTTPVYPPSKTSDSVTWDQIFPNEKPSSGVYTYDIIVTGIGTTEPGNSRLNWGYSIGYVEVTIENDDPVTGELTLKVSFDVVNQSGMAANVTSAQVWPVNPRLVEQPTPIPVTQTQQGNTVHCEGTWNLLADTPEELGTWSFVADAEVNEAEAAVVPEGAGNRTADYEVTGVALGFRLFEDAQMENPAERTYETYAGYQVLFRAFVRVNPHEQGERWYSSNLVNAAQLSQYIWIGSWTAEENDDDPPPQNVEVQQITNAARDALGLNQPDAVQWRKFTNLVWIRDTIETGRRCYGMNKPDNDDVQLRGWTHSEVVPEGTTWWGGKVVWNWQQNGTDGNADVHRMVCLIPTDRRKGHKRIRMGNGDLEYHPERDNNQLTWVERSRNGNLAHNAATNAFNWVQVGHPDRSQWRKLWLPDPSSPTNPWNGRISGRRRMNPDDIDFVGRNTPDNPDDDDPFFSGDTNRAAAMQNQARLNAGVMEWAYSFLGVPYGWGGQTYGGLQSARTDDFTCSDDTDPATPGVQSHRVDRVTLIGSSRGRVGYGIDCSGFVSECLWLYHREIDGNDQTVNQRPIWRNNREGLTAGGLRGTGYARTLEGEVPDPNNPNRTITGVRWDYVRPGDFAASRGHVFYARGNATVTNYQVQSVPTIEADPSRLTINNQTQQGRVRERTRNRDFIRNDDDPDYPFIPRRWLRQ